MLLLSEAGVPWDELRTWSRTRRLAAVVALGEIKGRYFNWHTMQWDDPQGGG
jgi:hypothetical protein